MGMYTCSAETFKDLFYHNGPDNCGQLEIAGIEVTCLVPFIVKSNKSDLECLGQGHCSSIG